MKSPVDADFCSIGIGCDRDDAKSVGRCSGGREVEDSAPPDGDEVRVSPDSAIEENECAAAVTVAGGSPR